MRGIDVWYWLALLGIVVVMIFVAAILFPSISRWMMGSP